MVLTRRLLYLALALSVVVVALPVTATLWVCLALLVGLVATDMLLAGSPRQVRVERVPGEAVRLGQSTTAVSVLHHQGRRRLRGSIKDGWQPSAGSQRPIQPIAIPPGGRQRISVPLRPRRRGDLVSATAAVRSLGPMGLAGRQVVHRSRHLQRVLPPFRSRRHLPSKLQRLRELDGQTAVQIRGAGTEFDSLRDYVRGDDVRSIDWRATARRRTGAGHNLVVRTWRPERDRRVILCLDSSRTSAARIEDEPRLDTGMEASLLLGVLAAGAGDRVDFIGFDRGIVARARSSSSGDFLHKMVNAMATMDPELVEADFSQLPSHVAAISSQRSLVVVLTSLESGSLEEGLLPVLPALTAKHLVLLAAVRDPDLDRRTGERETATEVYRAAAAEREIIEREAKKAQLTAMGVEVVDATPHELPPLLADTYIRLKATGRL
ncbi:DUF58 domain-containing protein [Nesterenkonia xinjiangensis]|uniref:Uncharacterized protein (DUF58 family) n=1 Tax=Nesterenkonia xinjiangensis TaxID=225327 RepID=A0A7Z0K9Q9_9MICC|nr:DUF58 domain-containing protein [Nesterenkonia xinjiangensis]NYJ78951.1 uncharacterized protein (DUF58 family) [Nesterenkonia xinjiangensis]